MVIFKCGDELKRMNEVGGRLKLTVPESILVIRQDIKIMHETLQRDFLFYLLCGVLPQKPICLRPGPLHIPL